MLDDYGNGITSAASIGVGSKSGAINYVGDHDYFKFVAPSSGTYSFTSNGYTDVAGYLYGSSGAQLAYDDNSAGNQQFSLNYHLTAGQTYYLDVTGYSNSTGAYTINVNPADDYGNSIASAASIGMGSSQTKYGNIDSLADTDYFKFVAPSSGTYTIESDSLSHTNVAGYLYNSSGTQLAYDDNSAGDGQFSMSYNLVGGTTYYVQVGSASSGTGDYSLTITPPDDYGNYMSTASSIGVGSKSGAINYAGDHDYFKFVAPSSGTYSFTSNGYTDVAGYLYGSSGVQLAYDNNSAGNQQFSLNYYLTAGQTYYLDVTGYSNSTGAYTINVNHPADDYGNSIASAASIGMGPSQTKYGNIDSLADTDYFKFVAPSSGTYTFESDSLSHTNVAGYLYNSSGTQLAYDDNSAGDGQFSMSYNLVGGTTYYVQVGSASSGTGDYSLTITPPDDYGNYMSTASSIGVGSKSGAINYAGDHDYFKFVAPSSGTYSFTSNGYTDVAGYLYGSSGVQLAYDNNSAGNQQFSLNYYLTAGQTYYLDVTGYSNSTGAYTINVNPADDYLSMISGSAGSDTIYGTAENDKISGLAGNDTLRGMDGDDILYGNEGNDALDGGAGSDSLDGGAGNDTIVYDTDDTMANVKGGIGIDTLDAQTQTNALTINLTKQYTDFENIIGGGGNDMLTGNTSVNVLDGGLGSDALYGGAGNDTIVYDTDDAEANVKGEAGSDTLDAHAQTDALTINLVSQYTDFENIIGGIGNDMLTGNSLANSLIGGVGSDILVGGSSSDTLDGGAGNDTIIYDAEDKAANVKGGVGSDTLEAHVQTAGLTINLSKQYTDFENIVGGSGNDTLTGNTSANNLSGCAGNDTLDGGLGNDSLYGGAGNDTIIYDAADTTTNISGGDGTDMLNAALQTSSATINLANYLDFENLIGGFGNDSLIGNNIANVLSGGAGNDTLRGMDGDDILYGNEGNDALDGGLGNDSLDGGAGNDTIVYDTDDTMASVKGGIGIDTLDAQAQTNALTINLTKQYTDFENITGGSGNDALTGNGLANVLDGGLGSDALYGGAGNDTIVYDTDDAEANVKGEAGNDTLDAHAQTDALTINLVNQYSDFENIIGGSGNDTLTGNSLANSLIGGAGSDTLAGGSGSDTLDGGAGNDTIIYDAEDKAANVKGGVGSDTLEAHVQTAGLTINLSKQYTDFENIVGGSGNDMLTGNTSANNLSGGAGNDTLDGGLGNDSLYGGAGNDMIIYDAADTTTNISGGDGTDMLTAALQTSSATINLANYLDFENLIGGFGNDSLTGNDIANVLSGGAGNDTLDGGLGSDSLDGGAGNDTIVYDTYDTMANVKGGIGIDTLDAQTQTNALTINLTKQYTDFENITGGSKNDVLTGNGLANVLDGGLGSDALYGGAGNDTIVYDTDDAEANVKGEAGNDTLDAHAQTGALTINLVSQYTDFENIIGGIGNDMLTGNSLANSLIGGVGSDILVGGSGSDTLDGGAGNDTIIYDAEDKAANVKGGVGSDTLEAHVQTAGLTINLSKQYTDFENIVGGSGNDTLTGNTSANNLSGCAGNDTLDGGLGNDSLYGGAGNDMIIYDAADTTTNISGGDGTDMLTAALQTSSATINLANYLDFENLIGGFGNDSLTGNDIANVLSGGAGNDTLDGGLGSDSLDGGAGNDTIVYDTYDTMANAKGGIGIDTLDAQAQNDDLVINLVSQYTDFENITGGSKNDALTGNSLANSLYGGNGNDSLYGAAGNDVLYGGGGNDVLCGGAGNDTYYFIAGLTTEVDTINNYVGVNGNGVDTMTFADLKLTDIIFTASGNDLICTATNGYSVQITNWLDGDNYQVDIFKFSDTTLTASVVNSSVI